MVLLWLCALLALLTKYSEGQCAIGQVPCGSICGNACDGLVDCPDRSDESPQLCSNNLCNRTGTSQVEDIFGYHIPKFRCGYGGCISETFVCNGHADCWDQTDETQQLCSPRTCTRRQFKCDYGACIRTIWACNGKPNCLDNSDETAKNCQSKNCRSTQFKCAYGACIDMKKRCDGSPDCIDNSDESVSECGAGHTTEAPPPPPVTTAPPVVVPPPPATPPSGKPDIVFTPPTPPTDWCKEQGLCSCPSPNEHFCVPCINTHSCAILGNGSVCSLQPGGGPFSDVKVQVLTCGVRPVVSVAGFVRNSNDLSLCGSYNGVPAESVVLARCWGTHVLAKCNRDGTWSTYRNGGGDSATPPSPFLCQFQHINSPVCGKRSRYIRPPGNKIHLRVLPHWPWMVGLKKDGKYICTATIITPFYLLTAGHCVTRSRETNEILDPRDVKVQRVDAEGRIVHVRISAIHLYPKYIPAKRPIHDVALIRTEREMLFSHQVYPACVHTGAFPQQRIAATFNRTVNEYTWEMILQQHDPRCHSPQDRCASTLGIDSQQYCAIDTELLRYLPEGSSGGPYMVNTGSDVEEHWAVVGLVSSSYRETSCTRPFTIFTAVTSYWPWIDKCVHQRLCTT